MAKSTKSNQISKIAIELAATIGSFSNPAVLKGYYQAAITIDLFNSEEEYNDFYDLLTQYMHQIEKNDMFDENATSLSELLIDPVVKIFQTMKERHPKATDVFILEAIYDLKSPKNIKESLAYITTKDVVSKRLVERTSKNGSKYVTMGMLTSKTITSYLRENNISHSEQAFIDHFLGADFAKNMFRYFKFDDLALCAKDPRFIDVALFSCYSMFQNKDLSLSDRYDEFVQYVKGEIKNIDIEKMQFLFCYKYYEVLRTSQDELTIDGLITLEQYRDTYDRLIPGSARIDVKPKDYVIPNPNSIKFEVVSSLTGKPINKEKELPSALKGSEFPVFVITEQDFDQALAVSFDGLTITKKDWIRALNETITLRKIGLLVNSCDRPDPVPEYLRKIRFTDEIIGLIYSIVQEKKEKVQSNSETSDISLQVLAKLLTEKVFTLNEALIYNTDMLCDGLSNGQIAIDMIQFNRIRAGIDRTKLIETSLSLPELYDRLLSSGNISKRDLYDLELSSYVQLVETFYNRQELTIDDVAKLGKLGKISITDIETMNLEKVEISDEIISSIYFQILEKRSEYKKYVEAKYSEVDGNENLEEDIPETEEERKLQLELQELIDLKNIYITLFKKQVLSPLVQYHRTTDIYNELVEPVLAGDEFDKAVSEITTMLYEDNMISMAQVREMDDNLFIEILKSGQARQEDIERFKQEIVSLDDIEKIRNELSKLYSGSELEDAIKVEIYRLRYGKLYDLMDKIVQDKNTTKEEKLSMLYSIFSKNTVTEKTHREFFESEILVKIYGKLQNKRKKPIIDPNDEKDLTEEEIDDDIKLDTHKNPSREFVYPTNVIWGFLELLDPERKFKILSDGYVVFESEKLNKAFIENVWQSGKDGDFIRRGYGTTTLILDLDTYKSHQAEIIRPWRHGYKVDVFKAKSHLPKIQTPRGEKSKGLIRHEKDLKNIGKKIWFELILEHLGITQESIDTHKTQYTQEDLDQINQFIKESRNKRDEITK